MKISFACMLLLSAAVLAEPNERYEKFRNQHLKKTMSVNRCDQVIGERKIRTNDNGCKEANTFILSTTNHVNAICGKAGKLVDGMTQSLQPFPIIVCKMKKQGKTPPNCQYSGKAYTRRIAIRCENGFPVHFDGDIAHFEN